MIRVALFVAATLALAPQATSRAIEIWSVDPIAVDIEWLTIDDAGRATVTARRQTAVGPPAPLEFAHAHDRYVRFSYKGASPRTYSTAELISARKLHVPDVLPGGELLLLSPKMIVRPVALEITGPRARVLPIEQVSHVSFAGVPAGGYTITPLYEGGLKGQPHAATVAASRSTILLLPAEPVGAVRIKAPRDVCDSATESGINAWQVARVGPDIRSAPRRARVISWTQPRCDVTVAGLQPGNFEAYFRRDNSGAGATNFAIAPQAVTDADVQSVLVRVEGRVTFNGRPVVNASVLFVPRSPQTLHGTPNNAEARTDGSGYYAIGLEGAGAYDIMSTRSRMGMHMSRATFSAGRNAYDIAITGGTIRIRLIGWDRKTAVRVTVQGANGSLRTSSVGPDETSDPVIEGLPYGDYRVLAEAATRTPATPRDMSKAQAVMLSSGTPEVTLTFDVSKR